MSFRDNLQHLRATRNMTQEQLAMLLGVSRQSVTKWEAERATPELDKLLKICQIFECSLDDLVTGDLTAREPDPVAASVPAGPPQDICGYDEHQRKLAFQIPTGVSVILAVIGLACYFVNEAFTGLEDGVLFVLITLVGIVAGCAFLIPAGMEHEAFNKAHPYIEDFYTEDDRARARSAMARALVVGLALILTGCGCIMVFGDNAATEHIGLSLLLLLIAAGVWPIIHWCMLYSRTNIAERNKEVAGELEVEDIVNAQIDAELKESLLATKHGVQGRKHRLTGAVCGTIMILATIVALVWLFVPMFGAVAETGDWGALDSAKTAAKTSLFWLPWPIGGLLCGIAALLIEALYPNDAA